MWRKRISICLIALFADPPAANAKMYEYISVCKRSLATALICVVVEEGVKKVVEKSVDEWWATWKRQGAKVGQAPPNILSQARCGNEAEYCVVTVEKQDKIITRACVKSPETDVCRHTWCKLAPGSDICLLLTAKSAAPAPSVSSPGVTGLGFTPEFCKENPALCRVADDTHKQGSEKFDEGAIDGWKAFMEKYELE